MSDLPIPTPHINAPKDAFAKTVLMPGDPHRAKLIAETYLKNPVFWELVIFRFFQKIQFL